MPYAAFPPPRRYFKAIIAIIALTGVCVFIYSSPFLLPPPPPTPGPSTSDQSLHHQHHLIDVAASSVGVSTVGHDSTPNDTPLKTTNDHENVQEQNKGAYGSFEANAISSGVEGGAAARVVEANLPDDTEEAFIPEPLKKSTHHSTEEDDDNNSAKDQSTSGDDDNHSTDHGNKDKNSRIAVLREKLQGLRDILGTYSTCAIVGESTSLYTGPRLYNEEIDRHDAVIRLPVAEGMQWYTNRQSAFKGKKTTLEIHYSGNKTWQGVPGVHTLCGAHASAPILLMPNDLGLPALNSLATPCAEKVATRIIYLTSGEVDALYALHEALTEAAPWKKSSLLFTEEWLATYVVCVYWYEIITCLVNE